MGRLVFFFLRFVLLVVLVSLADVTKFVLPLSMLLAIAGHPVATLA